MQTDYAKTSAKQAEGDFEFIELERALDGVEGEGADHQSYGGCARRKPRSGLPARQSTPRIYSPLASAGTVTLIRKLQAK